MLSADGDGVVYWGASKASGSSPWSPWIKRTTLSGRGTRTLLEPSQLQSAGAGSAGASGLIVFSTTDALAAGDTSRTPASDLDSYGYDLVTGQIELLSVDGSGAAAGFGSPSISSDGRFVAFEGGGCSDLALRDRWIEATRCLPIPGGANARLSAEGHYLIAESDAEAEQGIHLLDLAWQPPSWPIPSSIVMTGHDFTSIDFTWTPAQDNAQFPAA